MHRTAAQTGTKKRKSKKAQQLPRGAKRRVIQRHSAGIDVGSKVHYAAVDPRDSARPVRSFGCLTPELHEMALWLVECGVKTVAMESTGVYWVPVAQVLEEHGLEVCLVDARHVRSVPGRKSDVQDCQWLQQLHSFGLLSKVFLPDAAMQPLRSYWRQRADLVAQGARQIHHMHKALETMNIQLHKVLSDVAGTSGLRILRAIVGGERDAEKLAALCLPNVKNSKETFVKALTGTYREEQVFALAQALELYDVFQAKIADCDRRTEAHMATLGARLDEKAVQDKVDLKPAGRKRRKNLPGFDLRAELIRMTGVDLTQIDGIDAVTAFTVVTEQGIDMTRFPTEKHFASHLGLCPNHRITGGRIQKRGTRHVTSRAATALRIAAQSLYRSKSALGAYFRRMRARLGAPKAITAAAHKLAKLIYRMLRHGEDYVDKGQQAYEERFRKQSVERLKKQARQIGCAVVDLETGEVVA